MEIVCKTCEHRGSLEDALKTEKDIEIDVVKKLVSSGIYEFYGYDERIKGYRYILNHMEKNLGLPTWINVYGGKL